jgi:HAT1-interacting factor 1
MKEVEAADAKENIAEDGEEEEEGEPEDDFNAAWEVLDLARAIYGQHKNEHDEIALKLADTLIALGDVSLETEKFDQAVDDYTTGLQLKKSLLPVSSRQIAEAHYKLSIVLDMTPGKLAEAISHVEEAVESVKFRLAELRNFQSGQVPPEPQAAPDPKGKGKGKAGASLVKDKRAQDMSKSELEAEIKDLDGLREDLELKVGCQRSCLSIVTLTVLFRLRS